MKQDKSFRGLDLVKSLSLSAPQATIFAEKNFGVTPYRINNFKSKFGYHQMWTDHIKGSSSWCLIIFLFSPEILVFQQVNHSL